MHPSGKAFYWVGALWLLVAWLGYGQDQPAGQKLSPLPPPEFSVPGGVYTDPFTVELKIPSPEKGVTIRYTLDGSEPTEASAAYEKSLIVSHAIRLRARTVAPGRSASGIASQDYTVLAEDFDRFHSTLPLIVINTFGQPIQHRTKVQGSFHIVEPSPKESKATEVGTGQNMVSLTNLPTWRGRVDISLRGNTSLQFPKHSYTIKLINESGEAAKAAVAGLPQDSDWVLYGPYFDRTLLRDVLTYDLSNQLGRYAPRTRFVELFLSQSGGKLENRDYLGLYVLEEKIKRGRHRVDVADSTTAVDPKEAGIGYLFKMDHVDPDESGWRTGLGLHFLYVHPKEREITPSQSKWLQNYVNEFERTLHGPDFSKPIEGYTKYLDVDAFIDYFWLVELSKNVDAFRFSTFLQLNPGGKLRIGPIWDCDQSFGNANFYGGDTPQGWYWPYIGRTEINWFRRLIEDPSFRRRCQDRWTELRRGPFEPSRMMDRIDALVLSMGEAQLRNSRRWHSRRHHPDHILYMKEWLRARIAWMDQAMSGSKENPFVSQ